MGEAEKCPHPREQLKETPTAQIGGWEMIVLWVPYTGLGASRGLSQRYELIALKVLSLFLVFVCFGDQNFRRLEKSKSVPTPGSH